MDFSSSTLMDIYKNIRIILMGLLYPTAVLFKCEDYRPKIKYQVVESVQKNSGLPTYTFKLTGAEIRKPRHSINLVTALAQMQTGSVERTGVKLSNMPT